VADVVLLVYPGFAEFEVTVATEALREAHRLVTVAPSPGPLLGESGLRCLPDRTLDEVEVGDCAALIVPGGTDMFQIRDERASRLARAVRDAGALVAAISGGPYVLARAGILDEVPYTTSFWREHRDALGGFNEANYRDQPLVEAGRVITAVGWAYAEFGLLVAERLGVAIHERFARFFLGGHRRFGSALSRGYACHPAPDEVP